MGRGIFFLILLICLGSHTYGQRFKVVGEQSEIKFTVKNFGIPVQGSFSGLKGEIIFDENSLAGSHISLSIGSGTVNTGIGARDGHLRKADYFDVGKYPTMSFTSDEITKGSGAGGFVVKGILSIKGVAKPISITCNATKQGGGWLFNGEFTVNRREYGVGGGSFILSDIVSVKFSVQTAL